MGNIYFYKGELHRKRKEENDLEIAIENYKNSLHFTDTPAEVYRSMGLLDLKAGDFQEAKKRLSKYLELSPDAEDREMIEYYLTMEN